MKYFSMEPNQRLQAVIDYLHLKINGFARSLGMERSEGIRKLIRSGGNISPKLATQITNRYNFISYDWLVKGEGEMLIPGVEEQKILYKIKPFEQECLEKMQKMEEDIRVIKNALLSFTADRAHGNHSESTVRKGQ